MRRWHFIAGLGGAASWPMLARAQQTAMPVIGFLSGGAEAPQRGYVAAFRRGLTERGYVEGQNFEILYRWAESQYHLLSALAAEVGQRRVAVILTGALNRSGGNVTGISFLGQGLIPKRLELLRQIAPAAVSGGLLVNRSNPTAGTEIKQAEIAAGVLGLRLSIVNASVPGEIDKSITELVNQRVGGFATTSDILFSAQSAELAALAGRNLLPAVYHEPDITYAGGLLSYGSNIADAYRLAGNYVGRILKGERPSELPVKQAVKVGLVINLKTDKAFDLTIPEALLAIADEVIQ